MHQEPTEPASQEDLAKLISEGKVVDIVDGEQAQQQFAQGLAGDPWGTVAAACAPMVADVLGQIDLAINAAPETRTVNVPTGNKLEDGADELKPIVIRVADPARVESLAIAAERLIHIHDYAMRRSAKVRNQPKLVHNGKKR
jgi:hypothetical protein